jgi:DivIVA domain-containing protein
VVDFLVLVVATLVVGGLLFLGGSLLLGRGETQPPAELDRSPVELPDDRPVTADDVRGLRMSVALRGYRMTEVDWLLDQVAQTLDERDAEIARLEERLQAATRPSTEARPHEDGADGPPDGPPDSGDGGDGARDEHVDQHWNGGPAPGGAHAAPPEGNGTADEGARSDA